MPVLASRGAASLTGFGGLAKLGYLLRNSLRFRSSASAYLSRTGTTATNAKTATYSFWMKRGILSTGTQWIFTGGTTISLIGFNAGSDSLSVFGSDSSAEGNITTAVFRDPAAWYHVVIRINTTEGTAADRAKIYINGVQQAVSVNNSGLTLDSNWGFNTAGTLNIGRYTGASGYSDLYLAEVYFIDGGTPRDVSAFAKTDPATGQWIPIKYTGTYGNNGFYLNFNDASAATAAAIGKDSSGNGNNWTPNNISVTAGITYDSMTDVPTLTSATAANYATLNPLDKFTSLPAPTNGNLSQANGGAAWYNIRSTIGVASGKWYAEVTQSGSNLFAGVMSGSSARNFTSYTDASGLYAFFNNGGGTTGYKYANGTSGSSFTIASGDVIGLAYDYDAQTLAIYRNGNLQDTVTSIPKTETMFFCASHAETTGSTVWNFGQRPFAYTPPSGFKALNTFNLP